LAVLVNRNSGSASEIVAAALQDYHRALIIGDTETHGKGSFYFSEPIAKLTAIPLDVGSIKITSGKIYRITGYTIQGTGVRADIALPSLLDGLRTQERFRKHSLEADRVPREPFDVFKIGLLPFERLKAASFQRVAFDPEFRFIEQLNQERQKAEANHQVSLSEKTRALQLVIAGTQAAARDFARMKRTARYQVVEEISLSDKGMARKGSSGKTDFEFALEAQFTESLRIMMDWLHERGLP